MNENYKIIYQEVCKFYEIDIANRIKTDNYVTARFIYYLLCRKLIPNFTYQRCGEVIGRNHATVIHGINRLHDTLMPYDKTLVHQYKTLLKNLNEDAYFSYFKQDDAKDELIQYYKAKYNFVKMKLKTMQQSESHEIFKELKQLNGRKLDEFYKNRFIPFKKANC